MTRVTALLTLVVGLTLAVGVRAQARPDLSGTWRPAPGATTGAADPFEVNITQSADSVTLRLPGQVPESTALRLDGTETRTPITTRGGTVEYVSRAAWDGPRLVVTTSVTNPGGATSTLKHTYAVDSGRLSVETTTTNPAGVASPPRTLSYAKVIVKPLSQPPTRQVEAGFTSLFNGKDLTGWRVGGAVESFFVENGMIVARPPGGAAHLYYDGPVGNHAFQNFVLRLDVVARYRSNGGIYVMTEFQPTGFPAKGFEVQVNNSHTDRIRSGSLYHVVDLSHIPAEDDEWYPMEIASQGNVITISIKGEQVVRWVQPANWPGSYDFAERRIRPGTIAFQAHDPNSTTAYANIRVRTTP
jgi:hypothetical protein